ncbi:DNA polymerase III subunit delta [Candidatus Saccharibacteria bacterium]|nr:DNA polymerase III subunit delta [Candidatus Saccharibacteria bacterium]
MITVLTGENAYLLQAELRQRIADFVVEYTDMGLEQLDGEEVSYDRMREALESLPFLASKKLVLLRSPSANKQFIEKAADLLANVAETTDVIIVEPKPDKRTSYYKFLKKSADVKDFPQMDESSLSRWLTEQAKGQGGSVSLADARYLVDRVGANQQLLYNEITKLLNYNPKVTRQTIELLTDHTPQSTIFELLEAALGGNEKKALSLYTDQRAMKVEPQYILAMLAWQLHIMAVVSAADGRDATEIAKVAKINPFVVRKTQNLVQQMSMVQIKQLVRRALELDIALKSQPIDADEALRDFIMNIGQ